jgi:hypothetical protein
MAHVRIRPVGGVRIPMPGHYGLPHGAALPQEGLRVALDQFVRRLIEEGAAEIIAEQEAEVGATDGAAAQATVDKMTAELRAGIADATGTGTKS